MYAEVVVETSFLDFFFFSKKNSHAPVLLFAYVTVLFVEPVDRLVMAGVLLYVK